MRPRMRLPKASEERVLLSIIRPPRDPKEPKGVILPLGWKTYAQHWSVHVRLAILEREDCPDEILAMMRSDPDIKIRRRALQKLEFKKKGIFPASDTFVKNLEAPA